MLLGGLIAMLPLEPPPVSAAITVAAQPATQPRPPDYLASGIARVQAGDYQLGIMMLNEVVAAGATSDAATLARAHAYRAQGFLGLNRQDEARAAALLAIRADPTLSVTAPLYAAATVALFAEVRGPAAAISPEVAGAAAEQEGRYREALTAYTTAYQRLPVPAAAEDERRLREKILLAARRLAVPPDIPQQAREHHRRAQELIDAQRVLGSGGVGSLEAAAAELQNAIRVAPWWADATFHLATVLQQLQRVDAALLNLNLYRLADPEGYARAAAAKANDERRPEPTAVPARVASVYIYWPPQVRSRGTPKVLCNGTLVAELQKGRFIELGVAGGSHTITVSGRSGTFSFEPGSTYYLRASQEGFTRWSPFTLQLVDPNEGAAELQHKSIAANDQRRTYANQCVAAPPRGRQQEVP
jgi:tetratricopeptide (TPR) repeat protein